ncbi:MAG: hypothetical protein M1820_002412 [Bogoriella megaspora]|nr:MAG: hypothetical protein M1820_002412 [Bogoriella megaspora]
MDWVSIAKTSPTTIISAIVLALIVSLGYVVISRLVLSPIAKFPGPKLAAVTFWYEFYYDVIKGGRYTWKIRELHEKYGPIVRINPYEIHVNDPAFYYKLYTGSGERRDKWQWSMNMFGMKRATFATVPHDLHRRRRAAINPAFSKAAISNLEPEIRALVDKLCQRLTEFRISGEPANIGPIFAALTTDVVTKYCFGKAYGCVEAPDFKPDLQKAIVANTKTTVLAKQFDWLIPLLHALPHWMVKLTNPLMMQIVYFAEYITQQAQQVIETHDNKTELRKQVTVFDTIIENETDPEEKGIYRLMDDGISIVGAGLSTTADTLRVTTFHILNRPDVLARLQDELAAAIPDPTMSPPLRVLEQLPYLTAVINEGYRMACGIVSRLQRVSPYTDLTYADWSIPAGTPISMTIYLIHNNPDLFPAPEEFRPERWLTPPAERPDKWLVHFSKGTRMCAGMNLANAEIYLTLAYLFRRFNLTLFQTTRADADIEHDYFTAFPRMDSKGVRVLVGAGT